MCVVRRELRRLKSFENGRSFRLKRVLPGKPLPKIFWDFSETSLQGGAWARYCSGVLQFWGGLLHRPLTLPLARVRGVFSFKWGLGTSQMRMHRKRGPGTHLLCWTSRCKQPGGEVGSNGRDSSSTEVNDANFEQDVLKSEQARSGRFLGRPGVDRARALAPVVDEVATPVQRSDQGDEDGTSIRNNATPSRYGIRGIPALLLFKDGKVAEQIVGFVPKDTIDKSVNKVLATVLGVKRFPIEEPEPRLRCFRVSRAGFFVFGSG